MTSPLVTPTSGKTTRSVFVHSIVWPSASIVSLVGKLLSGRARGRFHRGRDLDRDVDARLDVRRRGDHGHELTGDAHAALTDLTDQLARRLRERRAGLHPQDERLR